MKEYYGGILWRNIMKGLLHAFFPSAVVTRDHHYLKRMIKQEESNPKGSFRR